MKNAFVPLSHSSLTKSSTRLSILRILIKIEDRNAEREKIFREVGENSGLSLAAKIKMLGRVFSVKKKRPQVSLNGILTPLLPRKIQPYFGKLGYVAVRRYSERHAHAPLSSHFRRQAAGARREERREGGTKTSTPRFSIT